MKTGLLIIDPQVDFCDPKGALYVKNAEKDMERVTELIKTKGDTLDSIYVSLDTHNLMDIAHPLFWINAEGKHPNPFTIISEDDVTERVWFPTRGTMYDRALDYVSALKEQGKYPLCIWPPHCLVGSQGNNVVPELNTALLDWENKKKDMVTYVLKGMNPFTEHYSIFGAEVPDAFDRSTFKDNNLIRGIWNLDKIYIVGEASSHCVANSVRDLVSVKEQNKKIIILKDGMSPVTGFEQLENNFFKEMGDKGVQFSTIKELL